MILFFLLISTACKTSKNNINSPEKVAEKFLIHFAAYEFEKAKELGTENTVKMLDLLQGLMDIAKKNEKEGQLQPKNIRVEIVGSIVDGNSAIVSYKDEKGEIQKMELLKVKGKWLVDLKKESKE